MRLVFLASKMANPVDDPNQFEQRKQDHIRLALDPQNQASGASGLDSISLIHEAIPDLNFADIDISRHIIGMDLPTPLFVSSMTAGHQASIDINRVLAEACSQRGWLMGVGSQRRQLFDPQAAAEWIAIRRAFPKVNLMGNIGLAQLIHTPIATIQGLVDSLEAVAMIVHTNPLQECIQPEGTPQFKGAFQAIASLCEGLNVPVIIKETGCGFSTSTLQRLKNIGVGAVDISGFGGTHWGRIEGHRTQGDDIRRQAAQTFKNWGIATAESLLNAIAIKPDYQIFASGGVRSGLDAAKLLAVGATCVGLAKPMLAAALNGVPQLLQAMEACEFELKLALFCTGSVDINALQENQRWKIIPT